MLWLIAVAALSLFGCNGVEGKARSEPNATQTDSVGSVRAFLTPPMTSSTSQSAPPACPLQMQLVDGQFCPKATQVCERYHPEFLRDRSSSERCLQFQTPSSCDSPSRQHLRFCIDTYEYPNRKGERPQTLTSWTQATQLCAAQGKRLCLEDEWLFACEGEQMQPYTYGFRRDPTACVMDRLYVPATRRLKYWPECNQDPKCIKHFEALDQREPAGSFPACRSPFGVYDMNGNANEWVELPDANYPNRSGLKGGWWGPVRDRCRPTVKFHKEDDWGYEVGFRCCQDAKP